MAIKKTTKPKKKSNRESIKSLKDKIEGLKKQLLEEKEEHQHIIDKNIRLLAEFDNYKRRTQEERIELLKYGGKALAKSLLPILDDLHRTIEIDGKTKARTILDGIELIYDNKNNPFLKSSYLKKLSSLSKKFKIDLVSLSCDYSMHYPLFDKNRFKTIKLMLKPKAINKKIIIDK